MASEKRRFPRYALDVECELHAGDLTLRSRTRNLSLSGIAIMMAEPLPLGCEVTLQLALGFPDNERSEPIDLPATVMWCTPLAGAFQLGARFHELSPHLSHLVRVFIQFLQAGPRQ